VVIDAPCDRVAAMTKAADHWEDVWLPYRPYATNRFADGITRQARPVALEKRFIEANPKALSNLLVVDIDHRDAALRALCSVGSHALPNAIVTNPRNGHAHALWLLGTAFARTEYAKRKPLAYAAAITEGLRRAVDGDKGYSGLMTKNPLHDSWSTEWLHDDAHTLAELEASLGTNMPPAGWRDAPKRRGDVAGLGRNCALFETARIWAYREVRHHWGDVLGLDDAIHAEVTERNLAFPQPLPRSEARAIASSISRWLITKSRMWDDGPAVYEATFVAIQSARSGRAATARSAAAAARTAAMAEASA
jgi:hypothetical protein